MSKASAFFVEQLLHWHTHHNDREMPWKGEADPYKIWLSEVILQQTRVAQGWSYYLRFVEAFPTVQDLAAAPDDAVMKLWEGLGYYSRARNLLQAARDVVKELNGQLPATYTGWRKLKGVGPYTAAAIASFAFNEDVPVVDGNVYRIYARYFGVDTPIDTTGGKKKFQELAEQLLPQGQARDYNQAIMDFGATVCTPKAPKCSTCPMQVHCVAKAKGKVGEWPVKAKKRKRKTRYFHYLVFQHNGHTFLRKRTGKDIWQGLHDFPMIEGEKWLSPKELQATAEGQAWHKGTGEWRERGRYQQQLTHQNIHAVFYEIEAEPNAESHWFSVPQAEITNFAFPKIVDCYLRDNTLYLTLH